jgi:glycosyltransferase involved in cell wall biosynthesis
MARISVVMACYNEEKNISRAIESILSQTFTDFEFIIIDDGSFDKTSEIIEQYRSRDSRIRIIKNSENRGHAYSLNVGINAAKYELIARMDSDDESLPERFEYQFNFLRENPNIKVLGTGASLYLKKDNRFLREHFLPEFHKDIVKLKFKNTFVYHPSVMAYKEVLRNFGGYDTNYRKAEDVDLWLRIIDKVTFHNLQKPLIKYSVVPGYSYLNFKDYLKMFLVNMIRRNEFMRNIPKLMRFLLTSTVYFMGYKPRTQR